MMVALPLAGFAGGLMTSEKAQAATKSAKKGSSAVFYEQRKRLFSDA